MKTIHRLILPLSVLCLGMLCPAVFAGDEWRPVTPEELAAKTPVVEKDADAEAIFWEVRIDDSLPEELSLKNYIRVKIFTERGKESQSKIDIRYVGDTRIKGSGPRCTRATCLITTSASPAWRNWRKRISRNFTANAVRVSAT